MGIVALTQKGSQMKLRHYLNDEDFGVSDAGLLADLFENDASIKSVTVNNGMGIHVYTREVEKLFPLTMHEADLILELIDDYRNRHTNTDLDILKARLKELGASNHMHL